MTTSLARVAPVLKARLATRVGLESTASHMRPKSMKQHQSSLLVRLTIPSKHSSGLTRSFTESRTLSQANSTSSQPPTSKETLRQWINRQPRWFLIFICCLAVFELTFGLTAWVIYHGVDTVKGWLGLGPKEMAIEKEKEV